MADLTELYKAQASINAQIKTAREEAARNGEVIIIDGKEYDSTMDFEGELPNPVDTDYFPTYRKDDNGDIAGSGEITYKALVEKFASEATNIKNQAIDAGNEALESISGAKSDALSSIGQSDTAGARGDAITSITNTLNAALSSIGKTDDEGARKAALDAIQSALTAALTSIGQTDSEGARKAALDAISAALTNALDAIGESNTEGARGSAISAINQLYTEIQTYITQQNTVIDGKVTAATNAASAAETSATNAASSESAAATSASNASTSESNAATSETNAANSASTASTKAGEAASSATTASNAATTATTKAGEASTSATNAASSAADALDSKNAAATSETNAANSESLAEKWATNPEDSLVDGTEYSAKHYAKKSEYWAGQAQAAVNIPDIYGYSETIGDGSTLEFTITHNMNTTTIIHDVWANTDDGVGFYSISTINANSLKITFEEAPAVGAITVNLLPVRLKNAN